MWNDPEADGCIYDTVDCDHMCTGCDYGRKECNKCGCWIFFPEKECDCDEMEAAKLDLNKANK